MTVTARSSRLGAPLLQRPPGIALVGAAVCALAAWVTAGMLAVTGDSVSTRVALLAPWWVPALVFGVLVGTACLVHRPSHAWWPTLVPGLLLLPWLPVPVPAAFLLWVGPMAGWVWAATAAALIAAWWPAGRLGETRAGRWFTSAPRRMSLAVAALGFLAYCGSAWLVSPILPAGDAPHYLVITQSLLSDHDLQIENNHARGDYSAYFSARLRPDYLRRGTNGKIYSIHAPGLPVLVAPAFALGGYPGVVVFLALICALGGWLAWQTALLLTGSVGAAFFGWAAVALSAPFLLHAFQVFPDATGAVLTMTGVAALVKLEIARTGSGSAMRAAGGSTVARMTRHASEIGTTGWLLHGAALACLPWLHTRYAAIAVVIGACVIGRLATARRVRHLVAFAAVPVVSAAAWFSFFYVLYGSFSPAAPYGSYTQSSLANVTTALPALLFDQQFGIIPNAPVYGVSLVGLALMFRSRPRLAAELTFIVFVYLAAVATYNMWWGGWSAPARFAVPVLLVLALPAADFWARRRVPGRAIALGALAVSLFVSAVYVAAEGGRLIFNSRDGFARWMDWVSPLVDLPRAVPSFLRAGPATAWPTTLLWVAALAIACAIVTRAARHQDEARQRARLAVAVPSIGALAVMAAVTLGWTVSSASAITPTSAQVRMLARFDAALRPTGLQYRPLRTMPATDLVSRLRLETSTRGAFVPKVPLFLGTVPAGTYRVKPSPALAAFRSLDVTVGRSTRPVEHCALDGGQAAAGCVIRLPIAVTALSVSGEAAAPAAAGALELQPLVARPEPPRPVAPAGVAERFASRAARYGGVQVFAFTELVYLEAQGLWVTGGRDDMVVVAPDQPGRAVTVMLRNGANANTITLRSAGWTKRVALGPREERLVDLPLDPGSGAVAVQVCAEKGFRPSDVTAGSRDDRYLGVWIEVVGASS